MKGLLKLYYRVFCVIPEAKAKELGFKFHRNVYGDEINKLNCRSLWVDVKDRLYRVKELIETEF